MADLNAKEYKGFEEIKHKDDNDNEFWFARELALVLEYTKWENFSKVIDRAMLACRNSGFEISDHFPEIRKKVEMPTRSRKDAEKIGFPDVRKTKTKSIKDYRLSRYACYLIVQNGDPRKEVIALGQTYFAIQTRRQEVQDHFDRLDEDNKRLVIRGNVKQWNRMLAEAAHNAGVITDAEFAVFQNSGYMGLYGGEDVDAIHKRKGLRPKERILDFMNSSELIANLFRITLAEERIRNENVQGKENATDAHFEVGKIVRNAIRETRSVMPEDHPAPKNGITELEREQIKEMKIKKNKMLDE
jgi:DNA-damage-inducible protein D